MMNDLVFHGLLKVVGERFIAAGDWNTARTQSSTARTRAGTEFFRRVVDAGWHDCVGARSSVDIPTYSPAGGDPIQDDHVFCDPLLGDRVVGMPRTTDDARTWLSLSDHAPLIVDFDVRPIAMTNRGFA
jgi:hypothetical protein